MKKNRRNNEIYPGIDNRFVICDVCGKKFRVKDTVRIVDRYNLLNNMIVCLEDADKTNPQIKPIRIHEDLLLRKDYVRPEATHMTYTNLENEDTIGSAPRNLVAIPDSSGIYVQLIWDGPLDYGNALVLGYKIYRGDQQVDILSVINPNTHSLATYYLDLSSDTSSEYFYAVSMVTDLGESGLSNYAYFPKQHEPTFLALSQNDLCTLNVTQNNYIIIEEN